MQTATHNLASLGAGAVVGHRSAKTIDRYTHLVAEVVRAAIESISTKKGA